MRTFHVHDLWGIFSGMLVLIALYLIVKNANGGKTILDSLFKGTGNLVTDLQGR